MKNLLLLSILLLTIGTISAQTPCGNLAAQPGKWVKDSPTGRDVQAVKNVNTAMWLFQKSVTGFTGGQAKTYLFTSGWVDTRPYKYQSYTVAMYFLQFECVDGKIKPEAATGTWIYIGFNEIPFFRSNNDAGEFFRLSNGQKMFYSQYKLQGNFKGLTQIAPIHHSPATAVFLSKSNRLPLRPVSQADVLFAYKKWFTNDKDINIKRLEDHLAKEPVDIARMDNDKRIADREASKKSLVNANNRVRQTVAQLKNERAGCIATVDSYLTKPIAKEPAVVEWIDYYCNPEKMFSPKYNAKQIVVFDDEYFDKTLPSASPQFIVVYWRKEDIYRFPIKREFIRKFEENFDFEALNKMLGK